MVCNFHYPGSFAFFVPRHFFCQYTPEFLLQMPKAFAAKVVVSTWGAASSLRSRSRSLSLSLSPPSWYQKLMHLQKLHNLSAIHAFYFAFFGLKQQSTKAAVRPWKQQIHRVPRSQRQRPPARSQRSPTWHHAPKCRKWHRGISKCFFGHWGACSTSWGPAMWHSWCWSQLAKMRPLCCTL